MLLSRHVSVTLMINDLKRCKLVSFLLNQGFISTATYSLPTLHNLWGVRILKIHNSIWLSILRPQFDLIFSFSTESYAFVKLSTSHDLWGPTDEWFYILAFSNSSSKRYGVKCDIMAGKLHYVVFEVLSVFFLHVLVRVERK